MIRLMFAGWTTIAIGSCVIFLSGRPVHAENMVSIGNGGEGGTTVEIADGRDQGALAVITFRNRAVNDGNDNGNYTLTLGNMEVRLTYRWNLNAAGDDSIEITAPVGLLCYVETTGEYGDTCELVAPEGTVRQAFIQAPLG